MSAQQLSGLSSMKIGGKLMPAEAKTRLALLSIWLAAICCLFALTELTQTAGATSINIYKHRYPFYGGWGGFGGYGSGHGGGFGGVNIGGFYGRR